MSGLPRQRSAIGAAFAVAAVMALLLDASAAWAQSKQSPMSAQWDAGLRNSVMRRVARFKVYAPGDGRVELGSGFVIDQNNRLLVTSCRILVAEWRTLDIDVAFATGVNMKRTAEPLLCDRDLDLAIVRLREPEDDFPRAVEPSPTQRTRPGDALYVLGFVHVTADVIPSVVDAVDTELPGLTGRFMIARSTRPLSDFGAPWPELENLVGGPIVTPQGDLVGVTALSSGQRIKDPSSGFTLATVPKDVYLGRTFESIAPFVRQALALKP
jgi:hypothetical protein